VKRKEAKRERAIPDQNLAKGPKLRESGRNSRVSGLPGPQLTALEKPSREENGQKSKGEKRAFRK